MKEKSQGWYIQIGIPLIFFVLVGMVPLAFAPPISVQINATILAVDLMPVRPFANAEIRVQNSNGTLTFVPCQSELARSW